MIEKSLRVFGIPEGQERPRWGNGHFFSPKNAWWKAVFMQARIVRPPRLLAGPLAVHAVYRLPRPKRAPLWSIWCPQKPDIDNIDKATLDAMTGTRAEPGRWWTDDKQIVHLISEKKYADPGESPGAVIFVKELTEEPCKAKLPN